MFGPTTHLYKCMKRVPIRTRGGEGEGEKEFGEVLGPTTHIYKCMKRVPIRTRGGEGEDEEGVWGSVRANNALINV